MFPFDVDLVNAWVFHTMSFDFELKGEGTQTELRILSLNIVHYPYSQIMAVTIL